MGVFNKYKEVFGADVWDKEAFRAIHHEDYMFIREAELLTLDEHVENMDSFVRNNDGFRLTLARTSLIHENEYVTESRWEDDGEIVTNITLVKNGKSRPSIVNRVAIEGSA